MNREQWITAYRNARLQRRRDWWTAAERDVVADAFRLHGKLEARGARGGPGGRRAAVWAFAAIALFAAALTLWRMEPGERRGDVIQVSVPAASAPAQATSPRSIAS